MSQRSCSAEVSTTSLGDDTLLLRELLEHVACQTSNLAAGIRWLEDELNLSSSQTTFRHPCVYGRVYTEMSPGSGPHRLQGAPENGMLGSHKSMHHSRERDSRFELNRDGVHQRPASTELFQEVITESSSGCLRF